MIRGITKPITPENALITDEQRRTAAGLYIAGIDALFAKFDPETGGDHNLPILAPFEEENTDIKAVAERGTKWLDIWAPDTQWHSYRLENNRTAVWRDDGILTSSLKQPEAEKTFPSDGTKFDKLEHLKRTAVERDALHLHEPAGMFVDGEEVTKLFGLLMQGQVDREALGYHDQ